MAAKTPEQLAPEPEPEATPPEPATTDASTVTPTPPEYVTGWAKQDPDSLAVAVRTNIPDPDSLHDWGVMTVDKGGHYAGWDEVSTWPDISKR